MMPDPDPLAFEERDPDEEWQLGFRLGLRVGRATYNPFLFFVGVVTGLLLGAAVARVVGL